MNHSQIFDNGNESVDSSFGTVMHDTRALYLHSNDLVVDFDHEEESRCVKRYKGSEKRDCHSRLSFNLRLIRILINSTISALSPYLE